MANDLETTMRSTMIEGPEYLRFIIPMRRETLPLLISPVVFLTMLGAGISLLIAIASGLDPGTHHLKLVQALGWTVGGTLMLLAWLWMIAGREQITFGSSALLVRREIFGIGRTEAYALDRVGQIRVAPVPPDRYDSKGIREAIGLRGGVITFDYDNRPVRCGTAIDLAEGEEIVDRARRRYGIRNGV
jgi:hypothetical protein